MASDLGTAFLAAAEAWRTMSSRALSESSSSPRASVLAALSLVASVSGERALPATLQKTVAALKDIGKKEKQSESDGGDDAAWAKHLSTAERTSALSLVVSVALSVSESTWMRVPSSLTSLMVALIAQDHALVHDLNAHLAQSTRALTLATSLPPPLLALLPWTALLSSQASLVSTCATQLLSADAPALAEMQSRAEQLCQAQCSLLDAYGRAPSQPALSVHVDALSLLQSSALRLLSSEERCHNDLLYASSQLAVRVLLATSSPLLASLASSSPSASLCRAHSSAHTALLRALALLAPDALLFHPRPQLWHALLQLLAHHCDAAVDRFARFVAFQGVEAALQRRVAQLSAHVDSDDSDVDAVVPAVLQLLYRHWEDALDAVVAQIRASFRTLLALYDCASLSRREPLLVREVASALLALDGGVKGKYALLSTLADRLGAHALLQLRPALLADLYAAMTAHRTLAAQIAKFHELLLRALPREEVHARVQEALTPLLLAHVDTDAWTVLLQYALPPLVSLLGNDSWRALTTHVSTWSLGSQERAGEVSTWSAERLRAVLALTQMARAHGSGDVLSEAELERLVRVAVDDGDGDVRQSALELVCTTHKRAEPPTWTDLRLLEHYLRVALDDDAPRHRDPRLQCVRRLLVRLHDSARKHVKALERPLHVHVEDATKRAAAEADRSVHVEALAGSVRFLSRVSALLSAQLFPGATVARVSNALELLHALLDVCAPLTQHAELLRWRTLALIGEAEECVLVSPLLVHALVRTIGDAHTIPAGHVRSLALKTLLLLSAPLPGLESPAALVDCVNAALVRVASARAADRDAGCALLLGLITLLTLRDSWQLELVSSADSTRLTCVRVRVAADLSAALRSHALCASLLAHAEAQLSAWSAVGAATACVRGVSLHGAVAALRLALAAALDALTPHDRALPNAHWSTLLANCLTFLQRVLVSVRVFTHPLTYREHCGGALEADLGSAAQAVVVCAWQAVHESMDALAALVVKAPSLALPVGALQTAGDALLDTMLRVIHKGLAEHEEPLLLLAAHALSRAELGSAPVSAWLEQLLAVVAGNAYAALINTRRSAALPFAMRALLAAEARASSASARTLQQRAMSTLLALAESGGTGSEAERETTRIHALNTLRAVLLDRRVLDDLGAYLERALAVLLGAYKSRAWGVRNSATLTFSALVQRYTGLKNPGLTRSVKSSKSVTVGDVFTRFPRLVDVLEAELLADALEQRVDSALFAALAFLSALLPARTESAALAVAASCSRLLRALEPARANRSWHVRNMVALAALPLLAPNASTWTELSRELGGSALSRLDANALHGRLLQILRFVEVRGADESERPALTALLAALLSPHARIFLLHAAPPLAALYIKLVRKAVHVLLVSPDSADSPLLDSALALASELWRRLCAPPSSSSSSSSSSSARLGYLALAQSARLVLALAFTPSAPRLLAHTPPTVALAQLLSHAVSEVRKKALTCALGLKPSQLDAVFARAVSERVHVERDTVLLGPLIELWTRLVDTVVDSLSEAELRALYARFDAVSAAEADSHTHEARAAAVVAATAAVTRTVRLRGAEGAEAWTRLLESAVGREEPLQLRLAAVKALGHGIRAFHVDSASPQWQVHVYARLWRRLLAALVDDGEEVRASAVTAVADALSARPLSLSGSLAAVVAHLRATLDAAIFIALVRDAAVEMLQSDASEEAIDAMEVEADAGGDEGASAVFSKDSSATALGDSLQFLHSAVPHLRALAARHRSAIDEMWRAVRSSVRAAFPAQHVSALSALVLGSASVDKAPLTPQDNVLNAQLVAALALSLGDDAHLLFLASPLV